MRIIGEHHIVLTPNVPVPITPFAGTETVTAAALPYRNSRPVLSQQPPYPIATAAPPLCFRISGDRNGLLFGIYLHTSTTDCFKADDAGHQTCSKPFV